MNGMDEEEDDEKEWGKTTEEEDEVNKDEDEEDEDDEEDEMDRGLVGTPKGGTEEEGERKAIQVMAWVWPLKTWRKFFSGRVQSQRRMRRSLPDVHILSLWMSNE